MERRKSDRRVPPSQHMDVTRLEHENVCGQIDELFRILRRFELELHAHGDRIAALEQALRSQRQTR
jgi:hypothetical protein